MIFQSAIPIAPPPDSLSIPQFILDSHHVHRPSRQVDHPWLIDDKSGKRYGLESCRTLSHALANALYSLYHLEEDQVACIYSPNHIDYPIAIWACHRLGAIVSGANPAYTPSELLYQLQTAKANLLFTNTVSIDVALKAAEEAGLARSRVILFDPHPSHPDLVSIHELIDRGLKLDTTFVERKLNPGEGKRKLAFLSFSSGTTGRPKAVAIPHASVIANVVQMSAFNRVTEDYTSWDKKRFRAGDTVIGVLPLYHIYGLVVNLHWMIFAGLAVVIMPKFVFEDMLRSVERYRITHLMVVPPMIVLLVKHPATSQYNLTSLRYVMVGAAPLSPEIMQQFWKKFPKVAMGQGYGMTETCTTVTMNPVSLHNGIAGSAGALVSGTIAKVVKPDGTLAGPNEPGELYVKGPQNAIAYYNNQQATKETFIDGWVRTGDEGLIDKDGNFFVTDRIKEIFKVKGFQVAPAELEGHILEHSDVADCAVVGLPDAYSGEVPLAYVMLQAVVARRVSTSAEEAARVKESIRKHVADHKVRYKWLDGGVEFIDVIPKNPSGKLLRRVLRERSKALAAKRNQRQAEKAKL